MQPACSGKHRAGPTSAPFAFPHRWQIARRIDVLGNTVGVARHLHDDPFHFHLHHTAVAAVCLPAKAQPFCGSERAAPVCSCGRMGRIALRCRRRGDADAMAASGFLFAAIPLFSPGFALAVRFACTRYNLFNYNSTSYIKIAPILLSKLDKRSVGVRN